MIEPALVKCLTMGKDKMRPNGYSQMWYEQKTHENTQVKSQIPNGFTWTLFDTFRFSYGSSSELFLNVAATAKKQTAGTNKRSDPFFRLGEVCHNVKALSNGWCSETSWKSMTLAIKEAHLIRDHLHDWVHLIRKMVGKPLGRWAPSCLNHPVGAL